MIVVFCSALTREALADNGSACVLHCDEVAASGFSKDG